MATHLSSSRPRHAGLSAPSRLRIYSAHAGRAVVRDDDEEGASDCVYSSLARRDAPCARPRRASTRLICRSSGSQGPGSATRITSRAADPLSASPRLTPLRPRASDKCALAGMMRLAPAGRSFPADFAVPAARRWREVASPWFSPEQTSLQRLPAGRPMTCDGLHLPDRVSGNRRSDPHDPRRTRPQRHDPNTNGLRAIIRFPSKTLAMLNFLVQPSNLASGRDGHLARRR